MNSKKFRLILVGVFALSILIFVGLCVQGLALLQSKSAQVVDLKLKNKTAEAQLSNLESSKKDIEKYSYFKSVASSVIPNDKDQAQAVLEILDLAKASGFGIQSISFPTSSLGLKAAQAPTTGTALPTTSNTISQATPVVGIPGLYSVQINISPLSNAQIPVSQQVTYAKMLDFLNRIENNRRTSQVAQVSIQPGSVNTPFNFNLVTNIFIKP